MSKRTIILTGAVFILLRCMITSLAVAQTAQKSGEIPTLTVEEILDKVAAIDASTDAIMQLHGVVIQGKKSASYDLLFKKKKTSDGLRTFVEFLAPEDTKGLRMLSIQTPSGDYENYVYEPAKGKVKKLSSKIRLKTFKGVDLSLLDLAKSDVKESDHVLVGTEEVDGIECYVVESRPPAKKGARIKKVVSYFRTDNFFPAMAKLYDEKERYAQEIRLAPPKEAGGFLTATKLTATNMRKKGRSVELEVISAQYDVGLSDDIFTPEKLQP